MSVSQCDNLILVLSCQTQQFCLSPLVLLSGSFQRQSLLDLVFIVPGGRTTCGFELDSFLVETSLHLAI